MVVLEAYHALKDQVFAEVAVMAMVAAMAMVAVMVEAAVMEEVAVMVEVALPEDIGVVEDEEASLCLIVHLAGIAEEPLERMAVAVVVVEPQDEIALTWVEEDLVEEHVQLYEAACLQTGDCWSFQANDRYIGLETKKPPFGECRGSCCDV